MIKPDEQAVDGIFFFRRNFAADEQAHENRRERDGEQRRRAHGIGFGERERFEQPAFLRLQREDRDERNRDDEQRVKQRRADFDRRVADDFPVRLFAAVALEMFVGVLDHDDDGVHHRADGDGDAAQRHDVRADALAIHDDERNQHGDRQDDDGDERAAQMHQEGQANQRDDDAFLEQFFLQRFDRAVDQRRAVVSHGVFDIGRKAFHRFVEALLDVVDDLPSICAVTDDDDAADGFTLAVQFRDAAPHVGAELDIGDLAEQNRHAFVADADRDFFQIVNVLDVAAHAQDEFLFRHLDGTSADFAVAAFNRRRRLRKSKGCRRAAWSGQR